MYPFLTKSKEYMTTAEETAYWRKARLFSKFHNIFWYVYVSAQRKQELRSLIPQHLTLRQDNDTRWNAWYLAIEWACKEGVEGAIMLYSQGHMELRVNVLISENWDLLVDLCGFRKDFFFATKATEGFSDCINGVLRSVDFLLATLETDKQRPWTSDEILPAIERAWSRLDRCYSLTDDSPINAASVVLDQCWKWTYFDEYWSDHLDWITPLRKTIQEL